MSKTLPAHGMASPHDPIHRTTCAVTLLVGLAGCGRAFATFLVELPQPLMAAFGITIFVTLIQTQTRAERAAAIDAG